VKIKNSFLILIVTWILSLLIATFHYLSLKESTQTKEALFSLIKNSSISFSVSWYEPRLKRFEKSTYSPYPEFPSAQRLSFTYGALNE